MSGRSDCRGRFTASLILLAVLAGVCTPVFAQSPGAMTSRMVLKVSDPDRIADLLAEKAVAMGGYFVERDNRSIRLKIPSASIEAFGEFAMAKGTVLTRELSSEDVFSILTEKKARLKSKRRVQAQYLDVLKTARADAVVMVEKEIAALVQEIEILQGEIRLLEHRLAFAEALIEFTFKDRSAPPVSGNSSFPWLNTVNITDLLEEFQHERE
ncbi:MAG: DUF4349 domain-containing protein [Thermodesulfobacteriota bacterium]